MSFWSVLGTCFCILIIFGTVLLIICGILEFSKYAWEFITDWKHDYNMKKSWKNSNKK